MADQVDEGTDEDAAALGEELRRAVGTFVRAVRREAGTPRSAQADALLLLAEQGAINVARMAQLRQVSHQTMRLTVAQLEADGLVQREPDPSDGRSRLLSLSSAGQAWVADDRAKRASKIEAAIRTSLSGQERRVLRESIALLLRMSGLMEE